jgi:hypothetical protein
MIINREKSLTEKRFYGNGLWSGGHNSHYYFQSWATLRHLCPGIPWPGVFFLDTPIDLFPEDNCRNGGLYAQSDLLATDLKDCDMDVIPDKEAFTAFSCDNQHGSFPGHRFRI